MWFEERFYSNSKRVESQRNLSSASGENYETSRTINCRSKTSFRRKSQRRGKGDGEKRNQTATLGDHSKLSIPADQREIISHGPFNAAFIAITKFTMESS